MDDKIRFLVLTLATVSFAGAVSCVSNKSRESEAVKFARLEAQLARAKFKIESLREQNSVLKNRVRIAKENVDGGDPDLAGERLQAFQPGLQLNVPISPTRAASHSPGRREEVSLKPRSLPRKLALDHRSIAQAAPEQGEQADRVLARTVVELLKSGDQLEAERIAVLLEKSYPESELVAETRFQQGLSYFRQKNWPQADRFFLTTLRAPKIQVRAKAGAYLMRGIIARRLAVEGAVARRSAVIVDKNRAISRKTFEYVRKAFPGSPEAKRAARELAALSLNSRIK